MSYEDGKMPGQVETYVGNVRVLVDYAKPGIMLSEISEPIEDKSATAAPILFCDVEIGRLANYLRDQECRFGGDSKLHRYSGIVAQGGYACIDMEGKLIFEFGIEYPKLARSRFLTNIWRIHTNQGLATHSAELHQWLDGHKSAFQQLPPIPGPTSDAKDTEETITHFIKRIMREVGYTVPRKKTRQQKNTAGYCGISPGLPSTSHVH